LWWVDGPHAGGYRIAGMDAAGLDIPVKGGVAVGSDRGKLTGRMRRSVADGSADRAEACTDGTVACGAGMEEGAPPSAVLSIT